MDSGLVKGEGLENLEGHCFALVFSLLFMAGLFPLTLGKFAKIH